MSTAHTLEHGMQRANTNRDTDTILPADRPHAVLVGRVWRHGPEQGPCIVSLRGDELIDITAHAATMADLLDRPDAVQVARQASGPSLGSGRALISRALQSAPSAAHTHLLAPNDVQAIKACGVTFAVSLLERLIEERSGGDPARADTLRAELQATLGTDLSAMKPGSPAALRLKEELVQRGAWSPYLEVGIGPCAEVFSKSQPMSAVGLGAAVGLHPDSRWNNPEPEIVLAVNGSAQVAGATLGNDVNLRDIEGRSALLLGKAKDNNGSCAIGPFIRLFDGQYFTIDSVRQAEVGLLIEGHDDGFVLEGVSRMREISRDPLDLVAQTCGPHHQYPDGFMLFLGTMFSPIKDRDTKGGGFTHHPGDRVTIRSPALGALVNTVQRSDRIAPWTFGVRALYANLAQRGLLPRATRDAA